MIRKYGKSKLTKRRNNDYNAGQLYVMTRDNLTVQISSLVKQSLLATDYGVDILALTKTETGLYHTVHFLLVHLL